MSDMRDSANKLRAFIQEQESAKSTQMTEEQAKAKAIVALLGELGGRGVTDDSIQFKGTKFLLPEQYEGNIPQAMDFLNRYYHSQEKKYGHNRTFSYRPKDGARAFQHTMIKMFGNAGIGQNTPASFFSPERPPQMLTINTGLGTTEQVPWGDIEFPPLEAVFNVGRIHDKERGVLFHLNVEAPKKFRKQIDAFFMLVEQELAENSIYKGKAITGAEDPTYLDTSRVDPAKVVYSEEVMTLLENDLWGRIRNDQTLRDMGVPLKRAVLLEGPYGTGKSLAGMLTAQEAQRKGWTYILCRPGQDDLFEVLQTAQLYAPSVVWFEDIDVVASGGNPEHISKLLDLLDGVQGKGVEVIAGFTTNFVENLQKGVLRPGRIDSIIHIGELDSGAYEKLIRQLVKPQYLGEIDYKLVEKSFVGFMPAFVTEAIQGALANALIRQGGNSKVVKIITDDLVNSALAKRRQLELMNGASEGQPQITIDSLMQDKLTNTLNRTRQNVEDKNGDYGLFVDDDREVKE